MPDEKKTEDTGIISPLTPDSGSGLAGSGRKKRTPGKTPLGLTLMIGFVICSLAVLAIMTLPDFVTRSRATTPSGYSE